MASLAWAVRQLEVATYLTGGPFVGLSRPSDDDQKQHSGKKSVRSTQRSGHSWGSVGRAGDNIFSSSGVRPAREEVSTRSLAANLQVDKTVSRCGTFGRRLCCLTTLTGGVVARPGGTLGG